MTRCKPHICSYTNPLKPTSPVIPSHPSSHPQVLLNFLEVGQCSGSGHIQVWGKQQKGLRLLREDFPGDQEARLLVVEKTMREVGFGGFGPGKLD